MLLDAFSKSYKYKCYCIIEEIKNIKTTSNDLVYYMISINYKITSKIIHIYLYVDLKKKSFLSRTLSRNL
jgi:hypothetical protein